MRSRSSCIFLLLLLQNRRVFFCQIRATMEHSQTDQGASKPAGPWLDAVSKQVTATWSANKNTEDTGSFTWCPRYRTETRERNRKRRLRFFRLVSSPRAEGQRCRLQRHARWHTPQLLRHRVRSISVLGGARPRCLVLARADGSVAQATPPCRIVLSMSGGTVVARALHVARGQAARGPRKEVQAEQRRRSDEARHDS